ncbi:FAD binding domain-containing protein [Xylaria nigripes]|nr:FAD binding domain-containing protein [Xylaria nigripes]
MESAVKDYITVDYLVVGAGPAGASLASFLAQNGLEGLVLSKAPGTADSPRSHVLNAFALETFRDLGIENDAIGHSSEGDAFQSIRWVRSMVGEEYGKVQAWGAHPNSVRSLENASPCRYIDLPQSYMEPILVRYASNRGFQSRFSTEVLNVEKFPGSDDSLCTVRDLITQSEFRIRSKYVFGADGARSKVAEALGISYHVTPQVNIACNIIFEADIGHLIPKERRAGLHSIIQPDIFNRMTLTLRMVRPWNQWIIICVFGPQHDRFQNLTIESPDLLDLIHKAIGDSAVPVKVHKLDYWRVNESIAKTYSVDGRNVFILGDAAHRHPPAHANGSNTCVQDAYNLGWKVAYVVKGLAGPKLLDSYSVERQPVGATLVREANIQLDGHLKVWEALGQFAATPEEGLQQIKELSEPTLAGDARRKQLHDAIEFKRDEAENIGLSMNQWYDSSAVYLVDEKDPRPTIEGNPVVDILISTYPGTRLPHAWLDLPERQKMISTHDLAGHGSFCLFVGHRGEAWREAAANITKKTGIPIKTYAIGFGHDYIDVYRDWYNRREVEEDGCVLVRPDRFVAWRSKTMVSDCEGKLQQVFDSILSRKGKGLDH